MGNRTHSFETERRAQKRVSCSVNGVLVVMRIAQGNEGFLSYYDYWVKKVVRPRKIHEQDFQKLRKEGRQHVSHNHYYPSPQFIFLLPAPILSLFLCVFSLVFKHKMN